jgi:hypothetical protein
MSIRAMAEGEAGKAEGKDGWIVSALAEGRSVDYVTKPAAGGSIVAVLEALGQRSVSEARNVGAWLESRLHLALTQLGDDMYGNGRLSREERITLSNGIGDALKAWTTRVEADAPALYERDIYDDPDEARPTSEAQPAVDPVASTPEAPPDSPAEQPPGPVAESPPAESATDPPSIDEPAPAGEPDPPGTDPAGPTSTEENEVQPENPGAQTPASPGSARQVIEAEVAQMRQQMAQMQARETARSILAAALSDGWIPPATVTRITESLMVRLPMAAGALDEAELTKQAGRELARAEQEIAEAMQAAGVGRPRDLGQGGSSYGAGHLGLDQEAFEKSMEASFISQGLTPAQAKIAARGRD